MTYLDQAAVVNLAKARAYVRKHAVHLSPTLFGMVPRPSPGMTAAIGGPMAVTDKLVLMYEPVWAAQETHVVLATGLAHECLHCSLNHIERGLDLADQEAWGLAIDFVVNGMLRRQKKPGGSPVWELPSWVALPEAYGLEDGLTALKYYELLTKNKPAEKPKSGFMCGCCGSIGSKSKGYKARALEAKANAEKGRTATDCARIAKEAGSQLQEYLEGPGCGLYPGGFSDTIGMSNAKFEVPWEVVFARALRGALGHRRPGQTDYSMHRPSRRSYTRGILLPGLIAYDPVVWVVLDSSLSMGSQQLSDSLRVTSDVMRQVGLQSVWWLEADAAVQKEPIRITSLELRSMTIHGRGGTDFRPAIELAQKATHNKPSLLLYMTDGDGTVPEKPPMEFDVAWCVVPSAWRRKPASWGTTIWLRDENTEKMPA